jgi:membrane-bound lytic murein transglycosylase B
VARLIAPARAGSAKDWGAYRDRFIEPSRIAAGRAFWQRHQRWLAAAETRFSVPAELIVGIIGVETFYGRITGDFRVLDALATLTLDYPKVPRDRTPFFRDELGQYLKLTWSQRLDPQTQRGSYAGAMGLGQFMPGSINRYAVDFDGDGRIDMIDSTADVIGSVANYIAAHGWTPGMPTHYAVRAPVDTTARATLLAPDIDPTFTAQRMTELGAELSAEGLAHAGPLALVELQNGDRAPSYVAGTSNFYTVTRYNHSSYYAMAVIGLGRAVAEARAAAGEDR